MKTKDMQLLFDWLFATANAIWKLQQEKEQNIIKKLKDLQYTSLQKVECLYCGAEIHTTYTQEEEPDGIYPVTCTNCNNSFTFSETGILLIEAKKKRKRFALSCFYASGYFYAGPYWDTCGDYSDEVCVSRTNGIERVCSELNKQGYNIIKQNYTFSYHLTFDSHMRILNKIRYNK